MHRVTSLEPSVGVSVVTDSSEGERFDAACRAGLPHGLLSARTAADRVAAARRFLRALLRELVPPHEAASFVRRMYDARFAGLAAPLRCNDKPPAGCEPERRELDAQAEQAASQQAAATAVRVARELRGGGPTSEGALGPIASMVLQDYVQHVAAFATGPAGLCSFVRACLGA